MDRLKSAARLMIISDLDHTMVDHHDAENLSLLRFNALWEANYRHDSLLVFSTGRSPTLYKELRKEKPMLTPDITITSVGTEITYGNSMVPDDGWVNDKWDRDVVLEETSKFPELTLQAETEQRPHKISFHVQKDKAPEVTSVLINLGGGIDLDILAKGAGKGQALAYLLKKFKSEGKLPCNTLACGDSGNDAELFSIPEVYGVMVSNAQEELLQWRAENAKDNPNIFHATERCAAGIIQAIGHFKLGPNISPRDVSVFTESNPDEFNPSHEMVKLNLFYEQWRRAEIEYCELTLASLKASVDPAGVYVHPSGFECSLPMGINSLKGCYGDKKGTRYRIWVDQVLPKQIGPDTWLVKYHYWDSCDEQRRCSATTIICRLDEDKKTEGSTWLHVHQTWLDAEEVKNPIP